MPNLCLFIKKADRIYIFLHIALISILSGMSLPSPPPKKKDTCHKLQKNKIKYILEMKWQVQGSKNTVPCGFKPT